MTLLRKTANMQLHCNWFILWHSLFYSLHINKSVLNYCKKAFHLAAYHPLTHCMCFSRHPPDVSTCGGPCTVRSLSEQVITGLQSWPPNVTSKGELYGGWDQGPVWGGFLYSEVQYILGSGHMGSPMYRMMERHSWKRYLPATSLASGNYCIKTNGSYYLKGQSILQYCTTFFSRQSKYKIHLSSIITCFEQMLAWTCVNLNHFSLFQWNNYIQIVD